MKQLLIIMMAFFGLIPGMQAQTEEGCSFTVDNIQWGELIESCEDNSSRYLSFWWDKTTDKVEFEYGSIDFTLGQGKLYETTDTYVIDIPKDELQPDTRYSYFARACCGDVCGEWSERMFFDTRNTGSGFNNQYLPDLRVYPNPTKDKFRIKPDGNLDTQDMSVSVSDMSGRHLLGWQKQDEYDIASLSPGIYLLMIRSDKTSVSMIIEKH